MMDPRTDLLQISFTDIPASPSLENSVRESFGKLARFQDWMTACRVTIQAQTKRPGQGKNFQVSIAVDLPDRGATIHRENSRGGTNQDLTLAIRTGFAKTARQLARQTERMNGAGRRHRHARQAVG